MLPNLHEGNMSMHATKLSEPFSASGSFLDAKSAANQPSTSEILFLKRLLFLKAALDND
jgi:hypothetical protein